MEMIKINQSELKVMLNADDMRKYDLENVTDNFDIQKESIRTILREAKKKTGFTAGEDRILVRMFPSKDGGCELFVTRLGARSNTNQESTKITPGVPFSLSECTFIYSFVSLSELISACRRLSDAGYNNESKAYRDKSRMNYYLVIGMKSPIAEEMGGKLMKMSTMYYINEYCSLFCDNAVYSLARFG